MMTRILLLFPALAALPAVAAFKCVDAKGVTHIGDQPPPACAKVPMQEVGRTGAVIRTIQPSLTAEEAKAKEEAEERKRAEEKAAAEQKRKDLALLSTYSSARELDIARDRNIEPLESRIKQAHERGKVVDARMKKIEEEMEFYKAGKGKSAKGKESKDAKGKDIPPQLIADMDQAKGEKATLAKNITGYEREIAEIRAKFEADKKRWLALKGEKDAPAKKDSAAADKPAPEKAAAKEAKPATK